MCLWKERMIAMKKTGSLITTALLLGVFLTPVCGLKADAAVYRPSPQRTVVDELPDANTPDAPAVVTVQEDDGPTTYVRTEDPENPENFEYIPEDEVPLADAEDLAKNTPAENVPGENPGGEDPAAVAVATPPARDPVKTAVVVVGGLVAVGAVGGGIAVATGVIGGGAAAGAAGAGSAAGAGAASGKGFFGWLSKIFRKR